MPYFWDGTENSEWIDTACSMALRGFEINRKTINLDKKESMIKAVLTKKSWQQKLAEDPFEKTQIFENRQTGRIVIGRPVGNPLSLEFEGICIYDKNPKFIGSRQKYKKRGYKPIEKPVSIEFSNEIT